MCRNSDNHHFPRPRLNRKIRVNFCRSVFRFNLSTLLLGVTLALLSWTQKKDREDLSSILIHDQSNRTDPYLVVIDTAMSDPFGTTPVNHIFLKFSMTIAQSDNDAVF